MVTNNADLAAHPQITEITDRLLKGEPPHAVGKRFNCNATLLTRFRSKLINPANIKQAKDKVPKSKKNKTVKQPSDKAKMAATVIIDDKQLDPIYPANRVLGNDFSPASLMDDIANISSTLKDISDKAMNPGGENPKPDTYLAIDALKTRAKINMEMINAAMKYNMDKGKDITQSPEFMEFVGFIISALEPFPEAKSAVVKALSI